MIRKTGWGEEGGDAVFSISKMREKRLPGRISRYEIRACYLRRVGGDVGRWAVVHWMNVYLFSFA